MLKRIVASLGLLLAVAAGIVSAAPAPSAAAPAGQGLVVIVLAPSLMWDDLLGGGMPFLRALAERSAIGEVNARLSPSPGTQPFTAGALTLSAGAIADSDDEAGVAYSVDESVDGATAAATYQRLVGRGPKGARVVYLGIERQIRTNSGTSEAALLGALGGAVREAGGLTAAVGNGDPGLEAEATQRSRPAGIVAMDGAGLVSLGDVSSRMLATATAPFGVVSDRRAIAEQVRSIVVSMATAGGPGLLVVDPGDLERAVLAAPDTAPDVAERQRDAARGRLDAVLSDVHAALPPGATLMVVSPPYVAADRRGPQGLAPIVVSGPGFSGLVVSPSTHRLGIGTTPDVAATALAALRIERPLRIAGAAMTSDGRDDPLEHRVAAVDRVTRVAMAIDGAKATVVNTYITITAVLLILCTLLLLRRDWPRRLVGALEAALLLVLAVPVASTLMLFIAELLQLVRLVPPPFPSTPDQSLALLVVTAVVLAVAAWAVGRRGPAMAPVLFLALLTAGTVLVDQWLGAPWALTSFFSYSPLPGARYYGVGNEGASLLVGSAVLGVGMLLDEYRSARWSRHVRRWLPLLVGGVVVVTCAAPFIGANFGVAIWGVVAFAVFWTEANGHKVTWKTIAAALGAVVLLVGAFAAYDLLTTGGQTHLARALLSAARGGPGELWTIVARKAETNLRVLTHTNWSYLLLVILGVLLYMRWRPEGEFAATMRENVGFKAALSAGLIASVAAYFTEDSGIIIPALVMLPIGVGLVFLMVARWQRKEA